MDIFIIKKCKDVKSKIGLSKVIKNDSLMLLKMPKYEY